jgi:hypothetical protein
LLKVFVIVLDFILLLADVRDHWRLGNVVGVVYFLVTALDLILLLVIVGVHLRRLGGFVGVVVLLLAS